MSLKKGKHVIFLKSKEDVDAFFRLDLQIPESWDAQWLTTEASMYPGGIGIYVEEGKVSGWDYTRTATNRMKYTHKEWVLPRRRETVVPIEHTMILEACDE